MPKKLGIRWGSMQKFKDILKSSIKLGAFELYLEIGKKPYILKNGKSKNLDKFGLVEAPWLEGILKKLFAEVYPLLNLGAQQITIPIPTIGNVLFIASMKRKTTLAVFVPPKGLDSSKPYWEKITKEEAKTEESPAQTGPLKQETRQEPEKVVKQDKKPQPEAKEVSAAVETNIVSQSTAKKADADSKISESIINQMLQQTNNTASSQAPNSELEAVNLDTEQKKQEDSPSSSKAPSSEIAEFDMDTDLSPEINIDQNVMDNAIKLENESDPVEFDIPISSNENLQPSSDFNIETSTEVPSTEKQEEQKGHGEQLNPEAEDALELNSPFASEQSLEITSADPTMALDTNEPIEAPEATTETSLENDMIFGSENEQILEEKSLEKNPEPILNEPELALDANLFTQPESELNAPFEMTEPQVEEKIVEFSSPMVESELTMDSQETITNESPSDLATAPSATEPFFEPIRVEAAEELFSEVQSTSTPAPEIDSRSELNSSFATESVPETMPASEPTPDRFFDETQLDSSSPLKTNLGSEELNSPFTAEAPGEIETPPRQETEVLYELNTPFSSEPPADKIVENSPLESFPPAPEIQTELRAPEIAVSNTPDLTTKSEPHSLFEMPSDPEQIPHVEAPVEKVKQIHGKLDLILSNLVELGLGSKVYLSTGQSITYSLDGDLLKFDDEIFDLKAVLSLVQTIIPQHRSIHQIQDLEFVLQHNKGNFYVNLLKKHEGLTCIFSLISSEAPSIESLGDPTDLRELLQHKHGLILLSSSDFIIRASVLAACLKYLNSSQTRIILSLEDPIVFYQNQDKSSRLIQREIGQDTESFKTGLTASLHLQSSIIALSDIHNAEDLNLAMDAAKYGHLVIVSLFATSASNSLDKAQHFCEMASLSKEELNKCLVGFIHADAGQDSTENTYNFEILDLKILESSEDSVEENP